MHPHAPDQDHQGRQGSKQITELYLQSLRSIVDHEQAIGSGKTKGVKIKIEKENKIVLVLGTLHTASPSCIHI